MYERCVISSTVFYSVSIRKSLYVQSVNPSSEIRSCLNFVCLCTMRRRSPTWKFLYVFLMLLPTTSVRVVGSMPSSSSGSDGGGSKRIRKAGVISSTIRTVAAVAALGAMSAAFSGMSPKKAYQAEQAKLKRRQRDGARLAAKALAAVIRDEDRSRKTMRRANRTADEVAADNAKLAARMAKRRTL